MPSRPTGESNLANPEDVLQTQETDEVGQVVAQIEDEAQMTVEFAYLAEDTQVPLERRNVIEPR